MEKSNKKFYNLDESVVVLAIKTLSTHLIYNLQYKINKLMKHSLQHFLFEIFILIFKYNISTMSQ